MAMQSVRPTDWLEDASQKYQSELYRVALVLMKNHQDAQDAVQEAFLRALNTQPNFENEEHEKAWFLRVTINICKDNLKSAWNRTTVELLDVYPAKDQLQNDLMNAILQLPTKYRIVIHLFYYYGYSTDEIAKITSNRPATVRSQLSRARTRLKNILEK